MEDELENKWSPKDLKKEIGILTIFLIIMAVIVTGAGIWKAIKRAKNLKTLGKCKKTQ